MVDMISTQRGSNVTTVVQPDGKSSTPIVGIAASAGGIEAFKELISCIPLNSGMAFVFIVHHDICDISNLPNLLTKYSKLRVLSIDNEMPADPNSIYTPPPNKNVVIEDNIFFIVEQEKSYYEDLPINVFFKSLANDKGRNAAAIILSGFGSFGTSSLGFIKNAGGIVIAQDPLTAKYDGMPNSAIQTGCVDYVLPIDKIPEKIFQHFEIFKLNDRRIARDLKCIAQINPNKDLLQNTTNIAIDKSLYKLINELNSYQIELELQNEDLVLSQLELEESRNKYVDLYDFAPAGYFTFDTNGLILEVNQMGADLIGIKKHALINRSFSRYIAPESQVVFYHHRQRSINEMSLQVSELKLLKRKGSMFHAQIHSKMIVNSMTGQKQIFSFINDITDYKQAEDLSRQHQNKIANVDRISSLNELASSIAHELNHPLGVINNFLHGCIRRLKAKKFDLNEIIQVMEQTISQSQRAAEIILRMKNFNCRGKLHTEIVCINTVINDAAAFIQYEITDYPVKIQFRISKHLPAMNIDRIHIEQVVINLMRNAIEAMRDADITDPKLIIETQLITRNSVEVCFIDNGPGVHEETVHKLFSPNFTTKPYGVGLGLAVSRTIIEAHGGKLSAELNPTYGLCFKFTLPISISP